MTADLTPRRSTESPAPETVRGIRHLLETHAPFNLLLAIQNDDNAPAAIQVTDALTARGAIPTVVRAAEIMAPAPGTDDAMVLYAHAMLGEDLHEGLARSIRELISRTTGRSTDWPVEIISGDPATLILQQIASKSADFLVMGIHEHGHFSQTIGENTATRVIGSSHVPVLAVRPGLSQLPRKIMVATDFGNASREAAHLAAALADPGGHVILVHVSSTPWVVEEGDEGAALVQHEGVEHAFLHLAAEISEGKSIRVETLSREGDAVSQLMAVAKVITPDLIAIASQRHHLLTRLLLGSVTRKFLREGSWPMLITPPSTSREATSTRT